MKFPDDMDDIFEELKDLTSLQRHTLKQRYRFLMKEYRQRCILYSIMFYCFRIIMTVGSLTVPAILSVQVSSSSGNIYWITWTISLAVTTANGVMTLFRIDKQFFTLHATAERLRSETWQYLQLAGRYSGHYGNHSPTHSNQFVYYCSQLEKINMKRVNDEYIKMNEEHHPPPQMAGGTHMQKRSETMVPSPPENASSVGSYAERKDSISTIEDVRTKKDTKEKDTITLQVFDHEQTPVSEPSVTRFPLLPESPRLQRESSVGLGARVQSGALQ